MSNVENIVILGGIMLISGVSYLLTKKDKKTPKKTPTKSATRSKSPLIRTPSPISRRSPLRESPTRSRSPVRELPARPVRELPVRPVRESPTRSRSPIRGRSPVRSPIRRPRLPIQRLTPQPMPVQARAVPKPVARAVSKSPPVIQLRRSASRSILKRSESSSRDRSRSPRYTRRRSSHDVRKPPRSPPTPEPLVGIPRKIDRQTSNNSISSTNATINTEKATIRSEPTKNQAYLTREEEEALEELTPGRFNNIRPKKN